MTAAADPPSLVDRRVLVLGGSAGIGRAVGIALGRDGARVAFAGRRLSLCEEAAQEAGGGALALGCDVTIPESCGQVVHDAADGLGGLDGVVYAVGLMYIAGLADTEGERWQQILATNVIGAAMVTRAALPHLQHAGGTAVFLSSVSSVTGPWPGIGAYTASKAALNRMVETWRCEHPEVGFSRLMVGSTAGGATTLDIHPDGMRHAARWGELQLASGAMADASSMARAVRFVLSDPGRVWDLTVQPNDPSLPWTFDVPVDLGDKR